MHSNCTTNFNGLSPIFSLVLGLLIIFSIKGLHVKDRIKVEFYSTNRAGWMVFNVFYFKWPIFKKNKVFCGTMLTLSKIAWKVACFLDFIKKIMENVKM